MSLNIPIRLLTSFIGLVCIITLGLGIPIGRTGLLILILFAVIGFSLAYFSSHFFYAALMFLLPVSGLFTNVFHLKSVSILMPYCMFGALGQLVYGIKESNKKVFIDLPVAIWLYMVSIAISTVIGVVYFSRFLPDLTSVVCRTPWGQVKLLNAFGWIALACVSHLGGLFFFISARGKQEKFLIFYMKCLFIGCFLSFIIGVFQFQQWSEFGTSKIFISGASPRFNAASVDPNVLSVFSASVIFIWLGYIFTYPREIKFFLLGPCIIFLMVISGSRSAFVFVTAGFLAPFLLHYSRKRLWIGALLMTVLFFAGFIHLAKRQLPNSRSYQLFQDIKLVSQKNILDLNGLRRFFSRSSQVSHEHTMLNEILNVFLQNRIPYWKNGWRTFKNHPLFGCGIGTYLIRSPQYAAVIKLDGNNNAMNDNACNMYLHVAAEQGIFGVVIFLNLIGSFLVGFLRDREGQTDMIRVGVFSSLVGLCVTLVIGAHLLNFEINILSWYLLVFLASYPEPKNVLFSQ